jgi:hypothetical protein
MELMIEDDIEDIGIINENNVFVPPPNIGSFKTINRVSFSKNIEESNTNTNNLHKNIKPILKNKIIGKDQNNVVEKKKISYENILSSMGMCVVDGKLQLFNKNTQQQQNQQQQQQQQTQYKKPQYQQQQYQQQQYQQQQYQQQQYQEQQQQNDSLPVSRLTKEHYKRQLLVQYINRQKEIIRINQVKSKKLMFPNPNVNINISNTLKNNNQSNKIFNLIGK